MRVKPGWFALLLFLAAILIRAGANLVLRDLGTPPGGQEGADGRDFDLFAWQMVTGHGYSWASGSPTAFRAPGFPLMLAGVYALFGHSYPAARVSFWVVGGISVVLTYLLARHVLPEKLARLSGLLGSIYFPHVYLASAFFNENLFAPLLAGGLLCFVRALHGRTTAWLVGAGVLLGSATLVRPFSLLLLPMLSLLLLAKDARRWQKALLPVLVLTASFVAPCVPWMARNHLVLGKPSIANNGGTTFWGGNNSLVASRPQLWGTWVPSNELPRRDEIDAQPDEVSADQLEWKLGVEWIRSHPAQFALLVTAKVVRLCLPDLGSKNLKYTLMAVAFSTPVLILVGLGVVVTLSSRKLRTPEWAALHVTLLATVLMAALFWGAARFRDANAPVLMVFAAAGVARIAPMLPRRLREALREDGNEAAPVL